MPLTAESGFQVWISRIKNKVNFSSVQDYLSRLKALPLYFKQQIAWMNKGIDEEITEPKLCLKVSSNQLKLLLKKMLKKVVIRDLF
jgi:uncharacterized protein (DUF885 family)